MSRNGNNVAKHEGESSTVQRPSMILGPESGTDLVRSGARGTSASHWSEHTKKEPTDNQEQPSQVQMFIRSKHGDYHIQAGFWRVWPQKLKISCL